MVRMPSACAVLMIRQAISPRLAISTDSNTRGPLSQMKLHVLWKTGAASGQERTGPHASRFRRKRIMIEQRHELPVDPVLCQPGQTPGESEAASARGDGASVTGGDQHQPVLLRYMWGECLATNKGTNVAAKGRPLTHGEDARLGTRMRGHRGAITHGEDGIPALDPQIFPDCQKTLRRAREIAFSQDRRCL